jgi:hypothetical protein
LEACVTISLQSVLDCRALWIRKYFFLILLTQPIAQL